MSDFDLGSDLEDAMEKIKPLLIGRQLLESTMLSQSAADGGVTTTQDAFLDMIKQCDLTVKQTAKAIRVNERKLQRMLDGEKDMTHAVQTKLVTLFRERRPDMFDFE